MLTTVGPHKNEAIATGSPLRTGLFRTLANVEALTMIDVRPFSHDRPLCQRTRLPQPRGVEASGSGFSNLLTVR